MSSSHGWTHPAHYLVDTTYCPVCLIEFHTRARVLEHIMYKGKKCRCYQHLTLRGPVIDDDKVALLKKDVAASSHKCRAQGHRRSHAAKPAVRLCGPLLPLILDSV
eukprot:2584783-Karenia_brevis.AAC.1